MRNEWERLGVEALEYNTQRRAVSVADVHGS